jgi:hypothetical protein
MRGSGNHCISCLEFITVVKRKKRPFGRFFSPKNRYPHRPEQSHSDCPMNLREGDYHVARD